MGVTITAPNAINHFQFIIIVIISPVVAMPGPLFFSVAIASQGEGGSLTSESRLGRTEPASWNPLQRPTCSTPKRS